MNLRERYQKFSAVFSTQHLTPIRLTRTAPFVRDSLNLQRIMSLIILASLPAVLFGIYNAGHQANLAMMKLGMTVADGWRGVVLDAWSIGYAPDSLYACFVHGLLFFLPLFIVTAVVAYFWEALFATLRKHKTDGAFLLISWLFVATLPPDIPLWQAALGISFGVVFGKEVFGGTGKNFLNPASPDMSAG